MFLVGTLDLLYLLIAVIVIVLIFILFIISRLKKCPSDKIMVIFGMVGKNPDGTIKTSVCIHGGVKFIYPLIQSYAFLDLKPITFNIDLEDDLFNLDIKVTKPSTFTVGISTEKNIMENAAQYLLGLKTEEIKELAEDIIYGQIRLSIDTMIKEKVYSQMDKFLEIVLENIETEISKIGLKLIKIRL